jgi:hypothetical protein
MKAFLAERSKTFSKAVILQVSKDDLIELKNESSNKSKPFMI